MKKHVYTMVLSLLFFADFSFGTRYWPAETLIEWTLELNNSVAYITSPQFATHCTYSRGQINLDGTEFNEAQYAYAMSAKARGKKLRYVIDDQATTCVITGLKEVE